MPDGDVFDRLLKEDDLETPPDLPAWETYGSLRIMCTEKGLAIVVLPLGGESAYGVIRFSDRTGVTIPPGSVHDIFTRAESVLAEGRSVWEHLDRDYLDPLKKVPVKEPEEPEEVEPPRVPPVRTGMTRPIIQGPRPR